LGTLNLIDRTNKLLQFAHTFLQYSMDRLGFKGTDPAMRCRGMQFKIGIVHRHNSKLEMCNSGFHFCSQLTDVHYYYPFFTSRVFIVQHGAHVLHGGEKSVTNEILFLHEITAATVHELMAAPEYKTLMCDNLWGLIWLFAAKDDDDTLRMLETRQTITPGRTVPCLSQ